MSSYRKMTDGDIKSILRFLASYDSPEYSLRWRQVEEHSKFTRQALQAHPQIKKAFQDAKSKLLAEKISQKDAKPQLDSAASAELVEKLYARIAVLEHQQELWRRRWFCIAYNIRNQGIQMFDVDKSVPIGAKQLSAKEIRRELERFEGDLPPVAIRGE